MTIQHRAPAQPLLILAGLALATLAAPRAMTAQVEASAGIMVAPDAGLDITPVGPTVGVSATVPGTGGVLVLDAAVGRTDFSVFGEDFHDTHYGLTASGQVPLLRGSTELMLRLGFGAHGVRQTIETSTPGGGGANWHETIVPSLVVSRTRTSATDLVLSVSDALLGPVGALLDPDEFDLQHRIRILVGVRF